MAKQVVTRLMNTSSLKNFGPSTNITSCP
jgi:hypothetical protein